ncbi:MAG TPA: zinc-dependent metalloprotease [Planctomycetaceae bacterium]|nr:zinc-dependent metalloprotease [Planctomycetaceae bacterium]
MRRTRHNGTIGLLSVAVLAVGVTGRLAAEGETSQEPAAAVQAAVAAAAPQAPKPDFPPHAEVLKDYKKVVSTAGDERSFYTLWTREKDGQMLAELPQQFANQKHFFAMTVAGGEVFAGLQVTDMYVYWRRFDKRLALIQPNVRIKATGDSESKASVERLFTDRVLLDVPILTMGPGGGPVIDMDALLVGNASTFFGSSARVSNAALATIKKAKAFSENVEIAFEVPTASPVSSRNGQLKTLHYSISLIKPTPGFKPRKADERVGYFITAHSDYGKYKDDETRVRYITRWHLEKKDSNRKVSLPKEPITFFIEHTTPPRYRYWVSQGILYWNAAFEKIGLREAIRVEYQDAETGQHMDKDPEDVRWNFVRWLNNDIGTAIGPSRINPETGQILDADIILTDGWIRHFEKQFNEVFPQIAMEGMSAETLAWLSTHPQWDPRVRMAHPAQRQHLISQIARDGAQPGAGHVAMQVDSRLIGSNPYDGLIGRASQMNGLCLAADGKSFDVAVMRMHLAIMQALAADEAADGEGEKSESKDKDAKDKDSKKDDLIDGMPEDFVGPLLAELVAHEVGHTLGLRHNFKSSSVYSLAQINSDEVKGKKPLAGSVMDYLPVNMNLESGKMQGDYTMIGIGPYDMWAIEYGYTFENDLKPILNRVAEPELAYATDEDTGGPDPLARRYDFSKNPLDYAQEQVRLANHHRRKVLDKFVKDGQSWSHARRGYEMTLAMQMRAVSMMAGWVGGTFVNRDKKGDKDGRPPLEVVPVQQQRDALKFVLEKTFRDDAYGLDAELLKRMTVDKWLDGEDFFRAFSEDPTWPVHDRVMGLQASVLTQLMTPSTLRRVYDNEYRTPSDQEALTLPELLTAISGEIWSELDHKPSEKHTARKPLISTLRQNLQREHIERLIDLTFPGNGSTAAHKPICNLSVLELRSIRDKSSKALEEWTEQLDPDTVAHLSQVKDQITKALDANYIYNAHDLRSSFGVPLFFFQDKDGAGLQR